MNRAAWSGVVAGGLLVTPLILSACFITYDMTAFNAHIHDIRLGTWTPTKAQQERWATEPRCVKSHHGTRAAMIGKMIVPMPTEVCDEYRMPDAKP